MPLIDNTLASPNFTLADMMKPLAVPGVASSAKFRTPYGLVDLLRPVVNNPNGSISTERTITIMADGKYYNIPTIFQGKELEPKHAIQLFYSGHIQPTGTFDTLTQAEQFARKRTKMLGGYFSGAP